MASCAKKNNNASQEETAWKAAIFKKSTEKSYRFHEEDGKTRKILTSIYVVECNAKGDTISETYYDSDGLQTRKEEYTYDKNGNMICATGYNGNAKLYMATHTYDEQNNLLQSSFCSAEGEEYGKTTYTYNQQGKSTGGTKYDTDGSVLSTWVYSYDAQGNLQSQIYYESDGSLRDSCHCTYDKQGHMLCAIAYNADGEETGSLRYTYDEHGNIYHQELHDEWYGDDNVFYTYDEHNNILTETNCDDPKGGTVYSKTVYTYNEKGNVQTKETTSSYVHYSSEWEYEY